MPDSPASIAENASLLSDVMSKTSSEWFYKADGTTPRTKEARIKHLSDRLKLASEAWLSNTVYSAANGR